MAEWWNKKYEFKSWSSLWVFLRQVGDLEEKRAIIYLEQLLENRYDTMDVLALASKQDLVEDAKIVPGDALRIIAAAKQIVARSAERSHHESKDGGETPQMHQTEGADQENSRRKLSPPRNGRIYYACGLCQITCSNERWLRLHFKGKKHADRMQQGEDDGRRTAVRYAGMTTSGELVVSPQAYHCSLCNITCSGKKNLIMHYKGRKHQAYMEEVLDEEGDEEDLQSVPSKPALLSTPAFPASTPILPSRPNFSSQPAFPRPRGPCTQDWCFHMKSTTRGLANLSMG